MNLIFGLLPLILFFWALFSLFEKEREGYTRFIYILYMISAVQMISS